MSAHSRSLLGPALFTAVAVGLFLGLSAWQWRRLAWKEALIERVETRARAEAGPVPPRADWPSFAPLDYEFRHVRASGHFDLAREALIFSKPPDGAGPEPGFLVLTPFVLDDGGTILVERGFIPSSRRASLARKRESEGRLIVTGLLRPPQSRNWFTPPDTPESGVWYTSDARAIAPALQIPDVAPFTLAIDPPPRESIDSGADLPRPVGVEVELTNNHLSYALTWATLAIATVGGFLFYARSRAR